MRKVPWESRPFCAVAGCQDRAICKGFCNIHYLRWHIYGDPLGGRWLTPNNGRCAIAGCEKPPRSKTADWCEMHHGRWRRNGDPIKMIIETMDRPIESHCIQCGIAIVRPVSRRFCSERCQARHFRGVSEQDRPCIVCGQIIPNTARHDKRFCSASCRHAKRLTEDIYIRDGYLCGLCGEIVDIDLKWPDHNSPSLDHIIPLSKGGSDTLDNVQLAHAGCNWKKGNRVNAR